MSKIIEVSILVVGTILLPFSLVQGFEVYTKSGHTYSASQYKIFETTIVISLKDGRQQKLALDEIDWSKTLGDKNVFQLVETNLVYTRDGKAISSKSYMIRHDEKVEVLTRDDKILRYNKSEIDFGRIANYLMKRRIKPLDGADRGEREVTLEDPSSPLLAGAEDIYCSDSILISSNGNPLIKFKFEVTTLKDARFSNLFLNFVTVKASAKNLSDTARTLSYSDFTLITSEGAEVKPDSSTDNTLFIGQLAKNAMTFGTIRFSFTVNTSAGFAKYLTYRGSYGSFKCALQ